MASVSCISRLILATNDLTNETYAKCSVHGINATVSDCKHNTSTCCVCSQRSIPYEYEVFFNKASSTATITIITYTIIG